MRRLVMIGNGMAATRLAEKLVASAPGAFAITLIGDEPHPAYSRIQLSPVLGGEKDFNQTLLQPAQWYRDHHITQCLGETVLAVDVQARRVTTTQRELEWDELVFTCGSQAFLPPLPGIDLPHVFAFRTLADVEAILATPGDAVVIGGGVLGVEAAAALRLRGDNVTLVHRSERLMEQQLDEMAGELLAQRLAERGIGCELGAGIAQITPDAVVLNNGRAIAATRVVMATGVRPNIALAQRAGIPCQRGIVVNRQLETGIPGVSAIGECCEIDGQTFGLVAPCMRQADVLAARLCGSPQADFHWQDRGTRLKVTGIDLFSAGRVQAIDGDSQWSSYDPQTGHYRQRNRPLPSKATRRCGQQNTRINAPGRRRHSALRPARQSGTVHATGG